MGAQWIVTPFAQSVGMLSHGELGVLDSNALITSFPEKFQNIPRIFESVFTLSPYAMLMLCFPSTHYSVDICTRTCYKHTHLLFLNHLGTRFQSAPLNIPEYF